MMVKIFKIGNNTYKITTKFVYDSKKELIYIEDGIVYLNKAHPKSYVFDDTENHGVTIRREYLRALIRAVPENKGFTEQQIDDEITEQMYRDFDIEDLK